MVQGLYIFIGINNNNVRALMNERYKHALKLHNENFYAKMLAYLLISSYLCSPEWKQPTLCTVRSKSAL